MKDKFIKAVKKLQDKDFEAVAEYVESLEGTIDRLNKELIFVDYQTKDYERVQTDLWKYQKALDRACVVLEYTYRIIKPFDVIRNKTHSEWKEWALKDE